MRDRATVTGIIDFGTFTMIGDPLYDLAAACGFYRMYEDDHAQTRDRLLRRAGVSLPPARQRVLPAYLLTGALLSCDLYPQKDTEIRDTGHYRWAASILDTDSYWSAKKPCDVRDTRG